MNVHRLYMAVIIFILLTLQTSFLPLFSWGGLWPDIMLCFVILVGFYTTPREGLLWGAATGLARDLFFGKFVGLFVLVYAATAYAAGYFSRQVYRSGVLMPAFTLFWGSLLAHLLVLTFVSIVLSGTGFWSGLLNMVLPMAVLNLFMFPILNRPVIWWTDFLRSATAQED